MTAGGSDRLLRALRYKARYTVSAYPKIYMPLARWHYRRSGIQVIDDGTELVIEGFGRSGSTFAVDAFEMVQNRAVGIAHHTHAAAQVITAARRGLPTLLIVRDPDAATLSHMVRRMIPARPALRSWLRYHRRVLPYRDRLLVRTFEEVTTDFGEVTRALNERFGTAYRLFDHTSEATAEVFATIEARNRDKVPDRGSGERQRSLARPTKEREALKASFRRGLLDDRLASIRRRAWEIYAALVDGPVGDRHE